MEFLTGDPNIELWENLVAGPALTVTHLVIAKDKAVPQHFVDFDVIVVPIKGKVEFYTETGDFEIICSLERQRHIHGHINRQHMAQYLRQKSRQSQDKPLDGRMNSFYEKNCQSSPGQCR